MQSAPGECACAKESKTAGIQDEIRRNETGPNHMLQDKEWLVVCTGSRAVFADAEGNRVEGFVELIDPDVGLAWIREQATGERRLITQGEYSLVASD